MPTSDQLTVEGQNTLAGAGGSAIGAAIQVAGNLAQSGLERSWYLKDREHEEDLYDSRLSHSENREDSLYDRDILEAWRVRNWLAGREDSAYQRAVADMLKAGLNPNSINGGAQASGSTEVPGRSHRSLPSNSAPVFSLKGLDLDFVGNMVKIAEAMSNQKLRDSEARRNEAESKHITAQTLTEDILRAKREGILDSEMARNYADKELAYQNIAESNKRIDATEQQIHESNERIKEIQSRTDINSQQKKILMQEERKATAEAMISEFNASHKENAYKQEWSHKWISLAVKAGTDVASLFALKGLGRITSGLGPARGPSSSDMKRYDELNKPYSGNPRQSPRYPQGNYDFDWYDNSPITYE